MRHQSTYRGKPTVKLRLLDLLDSGEAANYTTEELADILNCNIRTVATYELDWIRQKLTDRELVPENVALEIVSLRDNDGLKFGQIVGYVREVYDIIINRRMVIQLYRCQSDTPPPIVININDDDLPLDTKTGTIIAWCGDCRDIGNCDECGMEELCRELVIDHNFVACERPLLKELWSGKEFIGMGSGSIKSA